MLFTKALVVYSDTQCLAVGLILSSHSLSNFHSGKFVDVLPKVLPRHFHCGSNPHLLTPTGTYNIIIGHYKPLKWTNPSFFYCFDHHHHPTQFQQEKCIYTLIILNSAHQDANISWVNGQSVMTKQTPAVEHWHCVETSHCVRKLMSSTGNAKNVRIISIATLKLLEIWRIIATLSS